MKYLFKRECKDYEPKIFNSPWYESGSVIEVCAKYDPLATHCFKNGEWCTCLDFIEENK